MSTIEYPPQMDHLSTGFASLNIDILEVIFENLFEMKTARVSAAERKYDYYYRVDLPWITPESRAALMACTSVSRRWYKLASRRLFRCISIDSEDIIEDWLEKLQEHEVPTLPFVSVDLQIAFPSPLIFRMLKVSGCLRHLAIRYLDDTILKRHFPFPGESLPKPIEGLTGLLSLNLTILPKLVEIPNREGAFCAQRSEISYDSFSRIVSSLPNLRKLSLDSDFDNIDSEALSRIEFTEPPFQLEHFEVSMCSYRDCFQLSSWVLSRSSSLRSLALFDGNHFLPTLPSSAFESVTTLEYTCVPMPWFVDTVRLRHAYDMERFRNLEELTLLTTHILCGGSEPDNVADTLKLLPGTIKRLKIQPRMNENENRKAIKGVQFALTITHEGEDSGGPTSEPVLPSLEFLEINPARLRDVLYCIEIALRSTCTKRGIELVLQGKCHEPSTTQYGELFDEQ